MKVKLLFIFALLLTAVTGAWADFTPREGDVWDEATKTLTVNSDPDGSYYGNGEIQHLVIASGVTSISNSAFEGCTSLTTVSIPASVTSVGLNAFKNTPWLGGQPDGVVYVGKVAYQWKGNAAIATIADGTVSISPYAFYSAQITSVIIPASVTSIGDNAFYGCQNLTSVIVFATTPPALGGSVFEGNAGDREIYVPEGTEVGYWAAAGWKNYAGYITYIHIEKRGVCGNGMTWELINLTANSNNYILTISGTGDMDGYPWENYKSDITTVVISDGVTSISDGAFKGCTSLATVSIPASVTSIGNSAFKGCTSLATVSIPASVTSISDGAFEGCTSLTTVSIPASVTSVGSNAFASTPWLGGQPNGVVYVGKVAYKWKGNAAIATITDGTVSISPYAFNCAKITSVSIPASVTSIGDLAFNGCQDLTSVIIPASVTSIGNYAFQSCTKLEYVYVLPTTPPTIGYNPFNACNALTAIVVPAAAYDTYYYDDVKGWNSYQSQLKKNIANCTATVPDQTLGRFNPATNSYYKTNKISYLFGDLTAFIGEEVIDGETKLTLGTDYEFGTISYASPDTRDYWDVGNDKVGDVCEVEIVGKGNYAGSTTATFTIVDPSGKWGDDNELSWSLNEGALSITLTTPANGNKAMKAADTYGKYPWYYYCSDVTSISIGDGITSIANYAFGSQGSINTYSSVATVTLPSTLTSIGAEAFRGCSGATITIPTSVTTLGNDPFSNVAKVICTLNDNNSDFYSKLTTATSAEITYNRTFKTDVASTVCLPFDYTPKSEGTYYTFTSIDKETSPWTVTMTATAASLTANRPYMFMPATTGEVTFVGTASNFTYDLTGADVDDPTGGKWNLIGTYATKQWDGTHNTGEIGSVYGFAAKDYNGDSYTVNPGDFVKAAAGASIAPFRAYLKYTAPGSSSAPRRGAAEEALPSRMTVRLVNADGDVTAIGTIDTKTGEIRFDSDAWYTLDGRRLNGKPSVKGMYINNGKKIIVK